MLEYPKNAPGICGYSVSQYKAFPGEASVDLGRITLLLGRNNAGKTALLNAPLLLTHAFRPDVPVAFPASIDGTPFGASVLAMTHRRAATGIEGTLSLERAPAASVRFGAASVPLRQNAQVVTRLELNDESGKALTEGTRMLECPRLNQKFRGWSNLLNKFGIDLNGRSAPLGLSPSSSCGRKSECNHEKRWIRGGFWAGFVMVTQKPPQKTC